MSECYPTGCTPCTSPIDFPEKPADGDRHCVPIGSEGEQKCWVYDKCIPGWRAEGPAVSPTRYRGVFNVCAEKPSGFDEKAGDWVIAKSDCAKAHATWGLNLVSISAGDRVAFNGTQWQDFPPPDVPYAEEARDGNKPDPDDRMGGIVKNATVGQAQAGTDKCDTITSYTLNKVVQPIIDKLPDDFVDADDILWEINNSDRLVPKQQKDVLISAFTMVADNQSISGKLRLGTTDEAVTDTSDPAANDGRLSLDSGTIKIEDAAPQVPATEVRFAVFDENGYIIVGGNPADFIQRTGGDGGGGISQDLVLETESSTSAGRENDTRNAKALNIPSWTGLNADSKTTFTAYVSQNSSNVFGTMTARVQVQKAGLGALAANDADIFARCSWSGGLQTVWKAGGGPQYDPPTVDWTEVTVPDPGGVSAELWVYHQSGGVSSGTRLVGMRFNTTLYYKS